MESQPPRNDNVSLFVCLLRPSTQKIAIKAIVGLCECWPVHKYANYAYLFNQSCRYMPQSFASHCLPFHMARLIAHINKLLLICAKSMPNNQQRQQCEFHTQLEFLMGRLPVMAINVY